MFKIKRIYDPPEASDGRRVLVDRLWPRGISKAKAQVDEWLKETAPSTELRKWFSHDPANWTEFKRMYAAELKGKEAVLDALRAESRNGTVTFLYGTRDEKHNQAVALKALLES